MTGLNVLVAGVNWSPPEAQVTVARRVLTFLEDRRVLFVNYSWEIPDECIDSVLAIREYLTQEMQTLQGECQLSGHLRAMRAACRRYLSDETDGAPGDRARRWSGGHFGMELAFGELRATFGVHIAAMAAEYGLDVESQLASILPPADG